MTLNPKTTKFEFGGPLGVTVLTIFLPILSVVLNELIRSDYYIKGIFQNFSINETLKNITPFSSLLQLTFNKQVWTYYLTWFISLLVFDTILPGKYMNGCELRDGTKLTYKINGISMVTLLILILSVRWNLTNGTMPELQFLYDHILELCLVTIVFAFILSIYCYAVSFIPLLGSKRNGQDGKEKVLAVGGNSGNLIYDWFIGRELNPRFFFNIIDIKMFCELRPGMLLWLLINLSCLHHHYLMNDGEINDALLLVNILQAFYIFDGVLNEEGVLSMMDITTDGFGFMLAFGDLTFVPFTYSLQARYLSVSPITLGYTRCILISTIMCIGYYIFHSSNMQKSNFRQGKLENLKSIQTKRGTKLLCDGWWSKSQHINYFGDWLISLSWCLTTWFQTPLTYYYSIYFATLLMHRQIRDEEKCHAKYGKSWEEYQRKVPYKIIPYVY
ncbi:delta(14)-sterol reductase NDAI_0A07170 [Naumovozyma dairenensis CBS 421]|uniref:Delta(14)-sterol reductase n=1 Tax=Naumovozyma dairenensis (strain ATCC 10597 / BCRC 20456 / CBS 421 / NBRC 0211 / NRRL Y-12639) TaxID=1071378 RepID=G0W4Y3_NAUDC|nr:hypothetical protein NDAI_0A07170 [Naumovozyma dairenensis CBS 421]CCD22871.1 hypothetical protein NDAI_0A07170 [Naumovozyma dairenensis CBS 421]